MCPTSGLEFDQLSKWPHLQGLVFRELSRQCCWGEGCREGAGLRPTLLCSGIHTEGILCLTLRAPSEGAPLQSGPPAATWVWRAHRLAPLESGSHHMQLDGEVTSPELLPKKGYSLSTAP